MPLGPLLRCSPLLPLPMLLSILLVLPLLLIMLLVLLLLVLLLVLLWWMLELQQLASTITSLLLDISARVSTSSGCSRQFTVRPCLQLTQPGCLGGFIIYGAVAAVCGACRFITAGGQEGSSRTPAICP